MFWILIGAAALHTAFMLGELFPWSNPFLLRRFGGKLPKGEQFNAGSDQLRLVANVVKNAGIYNGILAGGLFWAAATIDADIAVATAVGRVLLLGAGFAGLFGTVTMKSWVTALQAVVGFGGFFLI